MRDSQLIVEALRLAERNGWQAHQSKELGAVLLASKWNRLTIQCEPRFLAKHVEQIGPRFRWARGPISLEEALGPTHNGRRVLKLSVLNQELEITWWWPGWVRLTRICLIGGAGFTSDELAAEAKRLGLCYMDHELGWGAGSPDEWMAYKEWVATLEPGPPDLPDPVSPPPTRKEPRHAPIDPDLTPEAIDAALEGMPVPSFWSRLGR